MDIPILEIEQFRNFQRFPEPSPPTWKKSMPFICAIDLYPKTAEGRDVADTDLLRNKDRRLEVGNAWLKIWMPKGSQDWPYSIYSILVGEFWGGKMISSQKPCICIWICGELSTCTTIYIYIEIRYNVYIYIYVHTVHEMLLILEIGKLEARN